ncbi:hypothetical protein BH10PSE19_BH10PSE19_01560 [soil metagenome]
MTHHNQKIDNCIKLCWDCRATCQTTLFNHCLQEGGKHAEAEHVKSSEMAKFHNLLS